MQRGEKEKRDSEDDGARSKENSMLISVEIWPVKSEVRERVSGEGGEPGRVEPGGEGRPGVNSEQLFILICIYFLYMYSLEILEINIINIIHIIIIFCISLRDSFPHHPWGRVIWRVNLFYIVEGSPEGLRNHSSLYSPPGLFKIQSVIYTFFSYHGNTLCY